MSDDDAAYFLARADAELTSAQRANGPAATQAHLQLAALYRERARTAAIDPAESETLSTIAAGQSSA